MAIRYPPGASDLEAPRRDSRARKYTTGPALSEASHRVSFGCGLEVGGEPELKAGPLRGRVSLQVADRLVPVIGLEHGTGGRPEAQAQGKRTDLVPNRVARAREASPIEVHPLHPCDRAHDRIGEAP